MERRGFLTTVSGLTANYISTPFVFGRSESERTCSIPDRDTSSEIDSEELARTHQSAFEERPFSVSIRTTIRRLAEDRTQVSKAITQEEATVGPTHQFVSSYRVSGHVPYRNLMSIGLRGNEGIDRYYDTERKYVRNHSDEEISTRQLRNRGLQRHQRECYTAWRDIRGLVRGSDWIATEQNNETNRRWLGYEESPSSDSVGFQPTRVIGAISSDDRFDSFRARFRRKVPDSNTENVDIDVLTCVIEFDDIGTATVTKPDWCPDGGKVTVDD
jgi:hypothetical protein